MKYTDELLLLGNNLSEGESLRVLCPACTGGSNAEKSLSLTRNEGLVWQCFRAKCGLKGATHGAAFSTGVEKVKPLWEGTLHEIPTKVAERIEAKWGIVNPQNWYWTTDFGGRVAMSVRSPQDTHRGWVLRALANTDRAKALTYIEKGEGLSWYKTSPHAPTALVEDIPSSVRASIYMNAVALLGTGIGMARAQEISEFAPRPILLCLDQDATDQSFKWARKWSLLWGDVKVLPLKKDLKDLQEEELKELLNEGETCTRKYNTK